MTIDQIAFIVYIIGGPLLAWAVSSISKRYWDRREARSQRRMRRMLDLDP